VAGRDTYETTQPWVTYHYGLTHDKWWPFWNSTRVLGRFKIVMACMVCGDLTVCTLRIPRFGPVPEPATGRHPRRERYLVEHAHPDRGHPMSWAVPLRNMAAHRGGLNLDLLGARLEADLNEGSD
jgi:hypothetical protein